MKTVDTIEIIADKHRSNATGALFLLDAQQKLVQIYFVNGEMVSMKSRNISGRDVIKILIPMKPVKFQFHDGAETRLHDDLPSTSAIITMIADNQSGVSSGGNETSNQLNDQIKKRARDLFVSYVGPIANVIFEEQVKKSTSLDNLIGTLSSYIDNTDDKQSFIQSLKALG